jgi:hypothetical protein
MLDSASTLPAPTARVLNADWAIRALAMDAVEAALAPGARDELRTDGRQSGR